jgi:hypothetical protein
VWKIAANILNKRTRGDPPAWEFGQVLKIPHCKENIYYEIFHKRR